MNEDKIVIQENDQNQNIQTPYNELDETFDELDLNSLTLKQEKDLQLIIQFDQELEELYNEGVFKKIPMKDFSNKFQIQFHSNLNENFSKSLFWAILEYKFSNIIYSVSFREQISKNLGESYFTLFTTLPKPKDQLMNYIIFGNCYLVTKLFFKYFKIQKQQFGIRFFFDAIHYIILKTSGLYISDSYIQVNMDRIFSNKMFMYIKDHYERNNQIFEAKPSKKKKFIDSLPQFKKLKTQECENLDFLDFQNDLQQTLQLNQKHQNNTNSSYMDTFFKDEHVALQSKILENFENQNQKEKEKQTNQISQSRVHKSQNLTLLNQQREKVQSAHIQNQNQIKEIREEEINQLNENKKYYQGIRSGKKKFMINKIGPAMSEALQMENQRLPYLPKQTVHHYMEKSEDDRYIFYLALKRLKKDREEVQINNKNKNVKQKQQSLIERYNIDLTRDEEKNMINQQNSYGKFKDFFKDMTQLEIVMDKKHERVSELPSSMGSSEQYLNMLVAQKQKKKLERKQKMYGITKQMINETQNQLNFTSPIFSDLKQRSPLKHDENIQASEPICSIQENQESQLEEINNSQFSQESDSIILSKKTKQIKNFSQSQNTFNAHDKLPLTKENQQTSKEDKYSNHNISNLTPGASPPKNDIKSQNENSSNSKLNKLTSISINSQKEKQQQQQNNNNVTQEKSKILQKTQMPSKIASTNSQPIISQKESNDYINDGSHSYAYILNLKRQSSNKNKLKPQIKVYKQKMSQIETKNQEFKHKIEEINSLLDDPHLKKIKTQRNAIIKEIDFGEEDDDAENNQQTEKGHLQKQLTQFQKLKEFYNKQLGKKKHHHPHEQQRGQINTLSSQQRSNQQSRESGSYLGNGLNQINQASYYEAPIYQSNFSNIRETIGEQTQQISQKNVFYANLIENQLKSSLQKSSKAEDFEQKQKILQFQTLIG